jgi:hypothetical protein
MIYLIAGVLIIVAGVAFALRDSSIPQEDQAAPDTPQV